MGEIDAPSDPMADVAGNGRVAFFSRCRPSGGAEQADPIEIVLRERRVFIGYPAWREGIEPRRGHLLEALIDFWCPEGEWQAFRTAVRSEGKISGITRRIVISFGASNLGR